MPEAKKKAEPEAPKGGGGVGRMLLLAGVVLVAAIGGLATYLFVLAPVLNDPGSGHEEAKAHGDHEMPAHPVPVEFPSTTVNVMREGDGPSSFLQFGVTLECNNEETAKLVGTHKARFVDIINKLHDSRTRKELDDTLLIKESIQRQALQKTNELLKKLQDEPSDEIKITAVLHQIFVVQDPV